ncbi:M28 family peptidase [Massilia sp.]|uniref:M28 family peptidase n=1 Tax=Massilia sp. TaxID=1882437 RepID=UPI00391AEBE1
MLTAGSPMAPARAFAGTRLAALAAGLLGAAVLAVLAWAASHPAAPPAPPAQAAGPALERMMRHVSVLAAQPRPIATAANARARAYIVEQLRAIGLQPQVATATVQKTSIRFWGGTDVTLGVVHNIVVRLPGSAPDRMRRPVLLLAAHYDSGNATLGAARGAAQVAAMIETARALHLGPAHPNAHLNDIVMLFLDGEEVGALGAKGFAEQHPVAGEVGLTLKFDATGSAGPLRLYGASNAGSGALGGVAQAAPGMGGSSLMARFYSLLPDTPRIGPLAAIDAPALLFANTGRPFGGQRTLDSVERLDPALLAHLGDTMLRLSRHFGAQTLARGSYGPHAWFTLPPFGSVQHSAVLCWGLAALAVLMLARGYRRAALDSAATVAPLVQGFFGVALLLLAARMLLWERRYELAALAQGQQTGPAVVFLVSGACLFVGALYLLRRLIGAVPVFLGSMAWLALALLLLLLWAPETAWLLAWPLAAALAAFTALEAPRPLPLRAAILAAGLLPAPLVILPVLREVWVEVGPQGLYVLAVLIAAALLCFASLLLLLPLGRVVCAGAAAAFAACLALPGQASGPAPAERPGIEPNRLVYFKDMNSWRAYWLLPPEPLDAWSKQLFPNLDKPLIHVDVFGWRSPRQWLAVAPREDRIAFPDATMLRNPRLAPPSPNPPLRRVEFTLRSKNRAPHVEMWVAGTKPRRSTLNGRVLTSSESPWSLSLYGMEDQLLRFTLDAPNDDPLAVMIEERIPGLPEHLLPPGAPPRMPGTGMTVSRDVLRFY